MHNPLPTGKQPKPREQPPESMRPDRPELVTQLELEMPNLIEPGIRFVCLAGANQRARNLTTGVVTFEPGASLRWHTHPFSESITLISGQAAVQVEGRRYEMQPHDNVVIPREIAHAAHNLSSIAPCVFHIALASDQPTRTLVDGNRYQTGNADTIATNTPERLNRFESAPRFAAGPNTEFIDFFNSELMPGIEMSGGYGMFRPDGRLPAHYHDFDESISIISGEAVCVVEGRRYLLSNFATAMVPRGRVHYFRNESAATMEMLWVYAGPMPERIVVHERCATVEGDPWK